MSTYSAASTPQVNNLSSTPGSASSQSSAGTASVACSPRQLVFTNIDDAVLEDDETGLLGVVVQHEDNQQDAEEDEEATLGTFSALTHMHIGDDMRNSKKVKQNSALSHCNNFLKSYMPAKTEKKEVEVYVPLQELKLAQIPPPKSRDERSPEWFSEMIGCFFYYLATNASKHCSSSRGRISYNTATGYASSIKAYLTNKFRDSQVEIPCFKPTIWKSLRVKLLNAFQDEKQKTGETLTNPHDASSSRDRQAIAVGCLWTNDAQFAEFWQLNNTMTHLSGRSSEVALLRVNHIEEVTVNEFNYQYEILQLLLKRHKNHKEQTLPVFPHRDSFHEDFYFSLIYSYILCEHQSVFLCPTYADKAGTVSDDKFDSQVSSHWKKTFKKLLPMSALWEHSLNPDLTSHHGKKGSNQLLANTNVVSGLAQIFRTGWEVRGFHSLFDYVVGSLIMSHQAGKAVANWTCKQGDNIAGGMPPTATDITVEVEKFRDFVGYIFSRDYDCQWSGTTRLLLVSALLRHYDDVVETIKAKPSNDFGNGGEGHCFVFRVKECLGQAGVSDETFSKWKAEVKDGFFQRNLMAIPLESLRQHFNGESMPTGVLVDPRCLLDHHNSIVASFNVLQGSYRTLVDNSNSNTRLTDSINRSQIELCRSISDQFPKLCDFLEHRFDRQEEYLKAIYGALREGGNVSPLPLTLEKCPPSVGLGFSTPKVTHPSIFSSNKVTPSGDSPSDELERLQDPTLQRYTFYLRQQPKNPTLRQHFCYFFQDELWLAYKKEQSTKEYLNLSNKDKKKIRSGYYRRKELVGFMLRMLDKFPGEKPRGDVDAFQMWKQQLECLASIAEQKVSKLLGKDRVSLSQVEKSDQLKRSKQVGFEYDFPPDTPPEFKELFSTTNLSGNKHSISEHDNIVVHCDPTSPE